MTNKLVLTWMLGIFMLGCTSTQRVPVASSENIHIEEEEEQHELIILDPGFETWFNQNARPVGFYSKSYYESQNERYVAAWNNLYQTYGGNSPFENQINYDFTKDYGLELNYRLFWYFKYVEARFGNRYNFPA